MRWRSNTAKDQVGSLLSQHNNTPIEVATDNTWHDRCVHDAQTFHPHYSAKRIDHYHLILVGRAHSARARGMIGRLGSGADEGVDVSVRLNLFTRQHFFTAVLIKCALCEYL